MAARRNTYARGQGVVLELAVSDPLTHEPIDPATVLALWENPDGEETSAEPELVAPGLYRHVLVADKSGDWSYRWETTDPAGADNGPGFFVERDRFAD